MRRSLLLLLLLSLAACAAPYDYPKETAAISAGVDALSSGFDAGYDGLAADRAAMLRLAMIAEQKSFNLTDACDKAAGKDEAEARA